MSTEHDFKVLNNDDPEHENYKLHKDTLTQQVENNVVAVDTIVSADKSVCISQQSECTSTLKSVERKKKIPKGVTPLDTNIKKPYEYVNHIHMLYEAYPSKIALKNCNKYVTYIYNMHFNTLIEKCINEYIDFYKVKKLIDIVKDYYNQYIRNSIILADITDPEHCKFIEKLQAECYATYYILKYEKQLVNKCIDLLQNNLLKCSLGQFIYSQIVACKTKFEESNENFSMCKNIFVNYSFLINRVLLECNKYNARVYLSGLKKCFEKESSNDKKRFHFNVLEKRMKEYKCFLEKYI